MDLVSSMFVSPIELKRLSVRLALYGYWYLLTRFVDLP